MVFHPPWGYFLHHFWPAFLCICAGLGWQYRVYTHLRSQIDLRAFAPLRLCAFAPLHLCAVPTFGLQSAVIEVPQRLKQRIQIIIWTCCSNFCGTSMIVSNIFIDQLTVTTCWPFLNGYINISIEKLSVTICCVLLRWIFMFRKLINLDNDLFQNSFLCMFILIQWFKCLFHRFSLLVVVIVAGFENRFHSSTGDRKMSKHIAILQNIDFYICLNISVYFRIF